MEACRRARSRRRSRQQQRQVARCPLRWLPSGATVAPAPAAYIPAAPLPKAPQAPQAPEAPELPKVSSLEAVAQSTRHRHAALLAGVQDELPPVQVPAGARTSCRLCRHPSAAAAAAAATAGQRRAGLSGSARTCGCARQEHRGSAQLRAAGWAQRRWTVATVSWPPLPALPRWTTSTSWHAGPSCWQVRALLPDCC
jgi:hypothetical protein